MFDIKFTFLWCVSRDLNPNTRFEPSLNWVSRYKTVAWIYVDVYSFCMCYPSNSIKWINEILEELISSKKKKNVITIWHTKDGILFLDIYNTNLFIYISDFFLNKVREHVMLYTLRSRYINNCLRGPKAVGILECQNVCLYQFFLASQNELFATRR